VVGAGDDEIHTDEDGRIKVQFHWDRDGAKNEKSSCWIRTMQAWGGQGWGTQFIPRVGMEVVVAFEGGDPDKPLVLGAVYNGTHPLPFGVPEAKTRSGIRTRSTPRANGFNELSFDDEAGAEQILLRAERDLVEQVGHDHAVTVTQDQRITVSGDQITRVTGARLHETLGGEIVKILSDSALHVGGERVQLVGGGERRTVDGDEVVRVCGRALHSMGDSYNVRTDGNLSAEAGTRARPATIDLYAWGQAMIGSGMGIALCADQRISFTCGESTIEISKDEIKPHAPKLRLSADKEIAVTGDGPTLRLDKRAELTAENVRIYSSKASLELDENAHIDGKLVKLACDTSDPSDVVADDGKPLTQPLRLQLADPQYEPYANKEFVVKAGGARVEGTTSGDGSLDVSVPIEAQSAEVTLWLDKRPSAPSGAT
jgi:type VI secretion system secreted protein VgrG